MWENRWADSLATLVVAILVSKSVIFVRNAVTLVFKFEQSYDINETPFWGDYVPKTFSAIVSIFVSRLFDV